MRIVSTVDELSTASVRRLDRLNATLAASIAARDHVTIVTANTVVEVANLWTNFNRFYFLSVSLGAVDSVGNRLSAPARFRSANAALRAAYTATKPGTAPKLVSWSEEPKWWDVAKVDLCLNAIGAPSVARVRSAVSIPSDVFTALQPFRNFYAHRSGDTAAKARRSIAGPFASTRLHPTDFLLTYRPGRPQCVLADWIDTLRLAIDLMR